MNQFATADRQHYLKCSDGIARIEITGSLPQYVWRVDLTAKRKERFVELRVLDRLVVEFTPEEARDFACALLKVASD